MILDEPAKLDLRSHDVVEDKKRELARLFPEIRVEGGAVDLERLKQLLGDTVNQEKERYGMSWSGKGDCFRVIQAPSTATLLPCPEDGVNFGATENVIIDGDNLEALKLLQKAYLGTIKMIYIDPPYNTGGDFIYPDDFKQSLRTYLEYTGQVDSTGKRFGTNPETEGRFHSKWLNMMYPRLYLARNLLREDGVVFISIDANEINDLRALCNEIFGEDCFLAEFIWKKKSGGGGDVGHVVMDHEYIVLYGKSPSAAIFNDPQAEVTTQYNKVDPDGRRYSLDRLDKQSLGYQASLDFPIQGPDGRTYEVEHKDPEHKAARWRWGRKTVSERYEELVFQWPYVYTKNYDKDTGAKPRSLLVDERFGRTRTGKTDLKALFGVELMDHPKPVKLMKHLIRIATRDGDLILDFFAGSGTLGQACLELAGVERAKCPFILAQIPEPIPDDAPAKKVGFSTVADILKERIRRVITKLNEADAGQLGLQDNPDRGFRVFKLAESNFRAWNADIPTLDTAALQAELDLHVHHIREDRTDEDILYELLLKSGFPLTTALEKLTFAGKTVYSAAGGAFLLCLERELTPELIRAIAERKTERVVCLDAGFSDNDQLKANAVHIFKTAGVKNFKTV